MATYRKPQETRHDMDETNDLALEAARHSKGGGGLLAGLVSALALLFSGISLYQTVVKQAQLHVFIPDTIAYTRDPDGNYEVFILPITLTNSGARDGIVSSLKLEARNLDTGATKTFQASYFTKDGYFSTREDVTKNIKRPKTPFAPLSVPSRGAYTGTILFYPRKFDKLRVLPGAGKYELRLTASADTTEHFGWLDRFWSTQITPLKRSYELPHVSRYFEGRMMIGHSTRLFQIRE